MASPILTFKVIVDLMPDFQATDVSKLTVERLVSDVTDADINERWTVWPRAPATTPPRMAPPPRTMSAVIDYEGSIDGVPFAGGKGEDFSLTLGSGTFIPGFEDGLIGAKAGEARDVTVTFPADIMRRKWRAKKRCSKSR
jgi:trigger factor